MAQEATRLPDDDMDDVLRREADEAEATARAALSPEQWRLVWRFVEARDQVRSEEQVTAEYEMADAIARHLPGLAPAIVALGHHIWENANEGEDRCGLVSRSYPARFEDPRCRVAIAETGHHEGRGS